MSLSSNLRFSYRKKIFFYFILIFILFTAAIALVQQNRERNYKNAEFKRSMDLYTGVIARYLKSHPQVVQDSTQSLQPLLTLLPHELRVSLIDRSGEVHFDNEARADHPMENHLSRPEVAQALIHGTGSHIRRSATIGETYYYYARFVDGRFVRVAMPYEEVLPFLRADNIFIYILLLLFFVALVSMLYLSDRFGRAVSGLHDFLVSTENHNPDYTRIRFPDTELGEIGNRIVTNYRLLCESRNLLDAEREKLLRHFHYSDEGICIFTPEGDTLYANSHFMQHLNTILDAPTSNPVTLLDEAAFTALSEFLKTHRPVQPQATSIPLWEGKISASGRHYAARLLIFNDNSYEITLNNITEIEKNRRLKQEMTNNIAHELKTPVTSIRGYLETLLEQPSIDAERHHVFLDRAYRQTLRLSDLIRDVALITKMEEATDLFERCEVSLNRVIEEVLTDLGPVMQRSKVTFENRITAPMQVMGDASLLYSVFWNLTDNAIHYAGEGVTLTLTCYAEDEGFYYLSFSDNGVGVPESELEKIFVRFYRVDAGRSRKTGGSGLGLSIVSNAVRYHGGQITAKNRREGGLEFLFSLAKEEGL